MKTRLVSKSNVPDLSGRWTKDDTEAEMKEIGITPGRDASWVEYVLDHSLDDAFDVPTDTEALARVLESWDGGTVTLESSQGAVVSLSLD